MKKYTWFLFARENQNSNVNFLNELETVYDGADTQDHNGDRNLDSNDPSTLVDVPVDSGFVGKLEVHETYAGAGAVRYNSYDDLRTMGNHVILNSVCSLLNRPSIPTHFTKKEWRFLQSFISK